MGSLEFKKDDFEDLLAYEDMMLSCLDILALVCERASELENKHHYAIENLNSNLFHDSYLPKKKRGKRKEIETPLRPVEKSFRKLRIRLQSPPPEDRRQLPERFRQKIEQIGGSNMRFVYGKNLTKTDMAKAENRFIIPKKHSAIPVEELQRVMGSRHNVSVDAMQPSEELSVKKLNFTYWESNDWFLFNAQWHDFVQGSGNLRPGGQVTWLKFGFLLFPMAAPVLLS